MSLYFGASPRRLSNDEFLRSYGVADGLALAVELLSEAAASESSDDFALAMAVAFSFGPSERLTTILTNLIYQDWHHSHEDIVHLLDKSRTPAAIPSFVHAARHVPDYLDFDDARALAVKAIWGLGNLPVPEAEEALRSLLDSDNEVVLRNVNQQLERRNHPTTD